MTVRVEVDGYAPRLVGNATAEPRAVAELRHLKQAFEDGHARPGMEIEKGDA